MLIYIRLAVQGRQDGLRQDECAVIPARRVCCAGWPIHDISHGVELYSRLNPG